MNGPVRMPPSPPWTCDMCRRTEGPEDEGKGSWWFVVIGDEQTVACPTCHKDLKPLVDLAALR